MSIVFGFGARELRVLAYVRMSATLHLFTNAIVPTEMTTPDMFNDVPRESGYAPKPLRPADWSAERIGTTIRATCRMQSWTFDPPHGGVVVHGWYVIDQAGRVMLSEKFDSPFMALRSGDELALTLSIDDTVRQAG